MGPGQRVLERGVRDGLDLFLIPGKVELESLDGRKTIIEADTEKAHQPHCPAPAPDVRRHRGQAQ